MVRIFPEALWHVYKVVQYIAFRYRDLKEGREGAGHDWVDTYSDQTSTASPW